MHPKFTNKNRSFTNKSKLAHNLNPDSAISRSYSSSQTGQLINTVLFKQLSDASDKLFIQITGECGKRIKAIKKSTAEALAAVSLLKKSLKSLFLSSNFSVKSLLDLKEFSSKTSLYYKNQSEEFNIVVDKSLKELGVVLEFPNIGTNVKRFASSELSEAKVKVVKWGTENDGGIKFFPVWINSQIEAGVAGGLLEINIMKKGQLVSFADLRGMKYYGVVNGKKLPPQDLKKLILDP